MVIYYRNKFLEVFGVSMLLFIFIIGWIIFLLSNVDNLFWVGMGKLMPAIGIIAYGLYIWSHYLLAKAKGYSGWLTLLALINTIGLAIIFLLPDRRKTG
ncbi:TPA: hypothetical protein DD690_03410 [Candidatus Daviesbacteria bacterium]|nr:MAG: hypothetical protein A3D02_00665 [Candidatus Daviesbacteria bacterium RIFCSPHIGHO2_02_FULL_39_41]OGE29303.1 MAG: hypothetical protein A2772_00015 [Candidatus Daviesbacteria bacterium RIFCSPHIGHO2_01_FULL_38_8b]OGE45204.1 MAG: hypothetical protein A3E67_01650 [Candidatus Daviesbacteria bacterium RIFCSPHIGHO2_12_FULL_38_25]OGE68642.1 MAG: hypothetical protein A3H81_03390 [Candidatus Daviesbacteria bacterium RIFCSPLOWO2_02_FULL_38_18]OGE72957.1 MAG: hypothetical protein A3H18_02105 [Candid